MNTLTELEARSFLVGCITGAVIILAVGRYLFYTYKKSLDAKYERLIETLRSEIERRKALNAKEAHSLDEVA